MLRIPFRQIGFNWQVPASWIKGRTTGTQTIIWGFCLGPGLITKNPYAGTWILPLLLTLAPNTLWALCMGAAIGVAHGGGRALGILRNRKKVEGLCIPIMVQDLWRWQFVDGMLLLLVGASLAAFLCLVVK